MSSISLAQRYERHEDQMKGCALIFLYVTCIYPGGPKKAVPRF